jgi:hypothetical protein
MVPYVEELLKDLKTQNIDLHAWGEDEWKERIRRLSVFGENFTSSTWDAEN